MSRHLGYSSKESPHLLKLIFLQKKQTLSNPSKAVRTHSFGPVPDLATLDHTTCFIFLILLPKMILSFLGSICLLSVSP